MSRETADEFLIKGTAYLVVAPSYYHLTQILFARRFESGGPPCQLIEHLPSGLIEMLEFARGLAVFDHGQVNRETGCERAANRRHLQLDGLEPQLLYRASAPTPPQPRFRAKRLDLEVHVKGRFGSFILAAPLSANDCTRDRSSSCFIKVWIGGRPTCF